MSFEQFNLCKVHSIMQFYRPGNNFGDEPAFIHFLTEENSTGCYVLQYFNSEEIQFAEVILITLILCFISIYSKSALQYRFQNLQTGILFTGRVSRIVPPLLQQRGTIRLTRPVLINFCTIYRMTLKQTNFPQC